MTEMKALSSSAWTERLLSDMLDGALLCEKTRTLCPAAPKLFTVKSADAATAL